VDRILLAYRLLASTLCKSLHISYSAIGCMFGVAK
jgi:hypothetical protein